MSNGRKNTGRSAGRPGPEPANSNVCLVAGSSALRQKAPQ
jgi:hypothetical protein